MPGHYADPRRAGQRPSAGAAREPAVLALAPRRGWRQARWYVRAAALAAPALLTVWWLLLSAAVPAGVAERLLPLWHLVLPASFFALARILRPYPPGTGVERWLRHAVAAAGAAYGAVIVVLSVLGGPPAADGERVAETVAVTGLAALVLASVTMVWGFGAAITRAAAPALAPPSPASAPAATGAEPGLGALGPWVWEAGQPHPFARPRPHR